MKNDGKHDLSNDKMQITIVIVLKFTESSEKTTTNGSHKIFYFSFFISTA